MTTASTAPLVVGISACQVGANAGVTLVTYALGSCIAVISYDPARKVGGLLHYMLPESSLDPNKAAANPYMFADTGIPLLFERMRAAGADARTTVVRLAGGAQVLDTHGVFGIGKRNYAAAKKALGKLGISVSYEAVGGESSRTVRLDLGAGKCWLREGGRPECELGPGCALRVLIVDGSPAMRHFIRRVLSRSGVKIGECLEAGSGEEVLSRLRQTVVDVILTGIDTPAICQDRGLRRIPTLTVSMEATAPAQTLRFQIERALEVCPP